MIKPIFSYFVVFISLYFISFHLHQYYLEKNEIVIAFSLEKMYIFLTGFSLLVCLNLLLLSTINNILDLLGFIYLFTIIIKIVCFSALFYESIILAENLSQNTRISIFISVFIFLLTEVIFIVKILNKKLSKK